MESILRSHHIIVKRERKAIRKSLHLRAQGPGVAATCGSDDELGMHSWKRRCGVRSGRSSRASVSPVTTAAGIPRSRASRAGSSAHTCTWSLSLLGCPRCGSTTSVPPGAVHLRVRPRRDSGQERVPDKRLPTHRCLSLSHSLCFQVVSNGELKIFLVIRNL